MDTAPGFDIHPGPSAETGASSLRLGAITCNPIVRGLHAMKHNVTFSDRLWYHRTVNMAAM